MNDWPALILMMAAYVLILLYGWTRPPWISAVIRQIERPVRWLSQKMRRNR